MVRLPAPEDLAFVVLSKPFDHRNVQLDVGKGRCNGLAFGKIVERLYHRVSMCRCVSSQMLVPKGSPRRREPPDSLTPLYSPTRMSTGVGRIAPIVPVFGRNPRSCSAINFCTTAFARGSRQERMNSTNRRTVCTSAIALSGDRFASALDNATSPKLRCVLSNGMLCRS